MTLRWGVEVDEVAAAERLDGLAPPSSAGEGGSGGRKKKKGGPKRVGGKEEGASSESPRADLLPRTGIPDVLLIGDVAYQHKPGAPSHFDDLVSTALRFSDHRTLLIFGTRMRMPASADLLDMFRESFDEVVTPPIGADELDGSFEDVALGRRHNITIHLMRRKTASDREHSVCENATKRERDDKL